MVTWLFSNLKFCRLAWCSALRGFVSDSWATCHYVAGECWTRILSVHRLAATLNQVVSSVQHLGDQHHWCMGWKVPATIRRLSLQPPYRTRSSSVVTLAHPPTSSSLKITDRSFRYASPCLWSQLLISFHQPHSGTSSSISNSPIPSPITSSSSGSPISSS